jgi:methylated-DNA-[protein]-cysteine S-methyltransferase
MSDVMQAEALARATDALRRNARAEIVAEPGTAADLALAARLVEHASIADPDPAFVTELRAALAARVRASESATLAYALLETPFGAVFVAYRDGVVVSAGAARDGDAFARSVAVTAGERPRPEAKVPEPLRRRLLDHLAGKRRFQAVDLSRLRPFQRRVLEKTAEIPRGEVRPYGWIAREIGAPGAVRAVGTALGHNPIPFIIPCHRVVGSSGSLTGFGGGLDMKEQLLRLEGASWKS